MSVTIKPNYEGLPNFSSPADWRSIKDNIERFVAENNLVLRKVIFAGSDFLGRYDQLNVYDGSTITLSVYANITEPEILFEKFTKEEGGWKEMSKQKPVATLKSGFSWWFTENFARFSQEKKGRFSLMMSDFLTKRNGYKTEIQIYEPTTSDASTQNFFFIPDFYRTACHVIDIAEEAANSYISSWDIGRDDPKKNLLINLVFGDYYRPYLKPGLERNEEFMVILRNYNERVGIGAPETLPELISTGGGNKSSFSKQDIEYKEKYIKYKNKYIELKKKSMFNNK